MRRTVPLPVLALIVLALMVLVPGAAAQDGAVGFHVSWSATPFAFDLNPSLLAGDTNGDGHLDLVASGNPVLVYAGLGDGLFATALGTPGGNWFGPDLGDLNGDGRDDFVTVPGNFTDVTVHLAKPDGSFNPGVNSFACNFGNPNQVVIASLDGSGLPDVAVGFGDIVGAVGVSSMRGLGHGVLALVNEKALPAEIHAIEAGELSADGTEEIFGCDAHAVAYTDASGMLTDVYKLPISPPNSAPVTAAIGDVTGDGLGDLVTEWVTPSFEFAHGTWPGTAGHALGAVVPFTSELTLPFSLADLDLDGQLDLVGQGPEGAALALGLGDGRFLDAQVILGGSSACWSEPVVGDFDEDGQPDVAVDQRCGSARTITLFLNDGPHTWWNIGLGLAGGAGVPQLLGSGNLASGSQATLALESAAPSAPVTLVFGEALLVQSFKGGVLVPTPGLILPGFLTDAQSTLSLGSTVPPGLPSGFSLFLQAWTLDAAAPKGLSASNALRARLP